MPPTLTPAVLKPAAVDRCDGDRILVEALAPKLLERVDIGVEVARKMLVTAGDNPNRMTSEAALTMRHSG